jgi:hypothetical protein
MGKSIDVLYQSRLDNLMMALSENVKLHIIIVELSQRQCG